MNKRPSLARDFLPPPRINGSVEKMEKMAGDKSDRSRVTISLAKKLSLVYIARRGLGLANFAMASQRMDEIRLDNFPVLPLAPGNYVRGISDDLMRVRIDLRDHVYRVRVRVRAFSERESPALISAM
jgi:hypothetical protein